MAKVVVDSDAIYALYNPNDPLNVQALNTFQQLIEQEFELIYPTSVLFEIVSLFQRALSKSEITAKIIEKIKNNELLIETIDTEALKEIAALFKPTGSKKNTLVDCSVVIIAKKIKADGVFAYDNFYKKQGLKMAGDLLN